MQLEEQENIMLELEEKLSLLDRPALEGNLQRARSDLQARQDTLQALQAEVAAHRMQQQHERKQQHLLHEKKLQARVRPQMVFQIGMNQCQSYH